MDVIDFIRIKVKETGSQSAVARKCGISQALINKMMQERYSVQIATIMKIASAYGVTFASFFNDDPPEYVGRSQATPADKGNNVSEKPLEYVIGKDNEWHKVTIDPEELKLLQLLRDCPAARESAEAMIKLPPRKQKIHLGKILEDLEELEEEHGDKT